MFNLRTIKEIIEHRNIKWLCHFTPRSNLNNIKKNGLLLRDNIYSEFEVTDTQRWDNNNNAICLSISEPNKWMFNYKKSQGVDLCLILIDPKIMYTKDCLFFQHNAATKSYRNKLNCEFSGATALEKLFDQNIRFLRASDTQEQVINRASYCHLFATTSSQAEVQCLENIESRFILTVFEENIPLYHDHISQRFKATVVEKNKIDLKQSKKLEPAKIRNRAKATIEKPKLAEENKIKFENKKYKTKEKKELEHISQKVKTTVVEKNKKILKSPTKPKPKLDLAKVYKNATKAVEEIKEIIKSENDKLQTNIDMEKVIKLKNEKLKTTIVEKNEIEVKSSKIANEFDFMQSIAEIQNQAEATIEKIVELENKKYKREEKKKLENIAQKIKTAVVEKEENERKKNVKFIFKTLCCGCVALFIILLFKFLN